MPEDEHVTRAEYQAIHTGVKDALNAIAEKLKLLEETKETAVRVDERTKSIKATGEGNTRLIKEHNGRIHNLEIWQARAMLVIGAASFIMVVAQEDVRQFIGKLFT